jgi:hypothetical protein
MFVENLVSDRPAASAARTSMNDDVPPGGQPPTSTAHGPVALDSDGGAHRSEKIQGRGFEPLVARSLAELFFQV